MSVTGEEFMTVEDQFTVEERQFLAEIEAQRVEIVGSLMKEFDALTDSSPCIAANPWRVREYRVRLLEAILETNLRYADIVAPVYLLSLPRISIARGRS